MNVSIAVQAHPIRREMADTLAARTGGEVVYDPSPDEAHRCPWRTYRHALEQTPADATHRLIVQDDALVCDHFAETVDLVVAARPGNVVCLFVPGAMYAHTSAIFSACERDETFALLPRDHFIPVVGTLWPVETIAPALAFVDSKKWLPSFCADDEIVKRAAEALDLQVLATVPSLVQHPDDVMSLIGNHRAMFGRNPDRVAACYIADGIDPRTIPWA